MGANSEQKSRALSGLKILPVNLKTRDEELKEMIAKSITDNSEPEGDWYDPNDSSMENYLRRMSWSTNYGVNAVVVVSLQEVLQDNKDAIESLKRSGIFNEHNVDDYDEDQVRGKLVSITCSYVRENDFLVEPVEGEHRRCARGKSCLGLVMSVRIPGCVDDVPPEGKGFILREFLLPVQLENWQRTGKLPHYNRHCLVCNRAITCLMWTKCLHEGIQNPPYGKQTDQTQNHLPAGAGRAFANIVKGMLRDWAAAGIDMKKMLMCMDHYYNRLDTAGEYREGACLSITPNTAKTTVPYHFLEFSMNRYEYAKDKDGKRFLREINVHYQPQGPAQAMDVKSDF
jgi:hypothetical protein